MKLDKVTGFITWMYIMADRKYWKEVEKYEADMGDPSSPQYWLQILYVTMRRIEDKFFPTSGAVSG